MGALYGLVLFVVMNFIVIPLSAMGYHAPSLWVSGARCCRTWYSSVRSSR